MKGTGDMYRTLIVPLDGSKFGEYALETAAGIAAGSAAKLDLLRVHRAFHLDGNGDGARWDEITTREEEEYLAHAAADARERWKLEVSTHLLHGPVADCICEHAQDAPAPLIIMSTHGRTGFSRAWLGSVADAVVRHSTAPVLLIRCMDEAGPPAAVRRFHEIIIALDGSGFAEQVVPHACSLAHASSAKLLLLRIVEPLTSAAPEFPVPYVPASEALGDTTRVLLTRAEDYVTALAQRLRKDNPTLDVRGEVCLSESPANTIIDTAYREHAEVVALATHGRGVSRLVIGSVADKVLRGGPGAVLALRPTHD